MLAACEQVGKPSVCKQTWGFDWERSAVAWERNAIAWRRFCVLRILNLKIHVFFISASDCITFSWISHSTWFRLPLTLTILRAKVGVTVSEKYNHLNSTIYARVDSSSRRLWLVSYCKAQRPTTTTTTNNNSTNGINNDIQVEMPAIPVLAGMEVSGVVFLPERVTRFSKALGNHLEGLKRTAVKAVGGRDFNLASPDQAKVQLIGERCNRAGLMVEVGA